MTQEELKTKETISQYMYLTLAGCGAINVITIIIIALLVRALA